MEKIEFHEIGEKFEFNGVLLEVVRHDKAIGNDCEACYFHDDCRACYFQNACNIKYNCTYEERKDGKEVIYKHIPLTIEDLKPGDFVAFEYNGNTVVTEITDDGAWFDYAVGLWFDDNVIGVKDWVWLSDSLEHVDDPDRPIQNLRYAGLEDLKRFASVIIGELTYDLGLRQQPERNGNG